MKIWLVSVLVLATTFADGQSSIQYSVVNDYTNDGREFEATQTLETAGRPFIDIVAEAAENDETFRYEAIDYGEPLGEYVYKINGLQEDRVDQAYWALLKQDPEAGACFVGLGVSYFYPQDGDHIMFSYLDYNADLPQC